MNISKHQEKCAPDILFKISQSDLIEFATSIHAAKIAYKNGAEASFNEIVQFLEWVFSKKVLKTIYDLKGKVMDRMTSTKFLDKLRRCFIEYANSKL